MARSGRLVVPVTFWRWSVVVFLLAVENGLDQLNGDECGDAWWRTSAGRRWVALEAMVCSYIRSIVCMSSKPEWTAVMCFLMVWIALLRNLRLYSFPPNGKPRRRNQSVVSFLFAYVLIAVCISICNFPGRYSVVSLF